MSCIRCLCFIAHSGVQRILCCGFGLCWSVFLRLVCPMLPVSLDCTFWIAPSVLRNICLMETDHKDNYSQEIILHMTFLRCTRVTNDLGF